MRFATGRWAGRTGAVALCAIVAMALLTTVAFAASTVVASNPATPGLAAYGLTAGSPILGQSFVPDSEGTLDKATFYLWNNNITQGSVHAELYAMSGSWGNGTPTGSPLATSTNSVLVSDLSTSEYAWSHVEFDFDDTFMLSPTQYYVIAVKGEGFPTVTDYFDAVNVADSNTGQPGNLSFISGGTWYVDLNETDLIFAVYAKPVATISDLAAQSPVKKVSATFTASTNATSQLTYTLHFEYKNRVKGKWVWQPREDLNVQTSSSTAGTLSWTRALPDVGTWRMYVTSSSNDDYGCAHTAPVEFTVARR